MLHSNEEFQFLILKPTQDIINLYPHIFLYTPCKYPIYMIIILLKKCNEKWLIDPINFLFFFIFISLISYKES
ncbi:LOW QUALITY PROTEIN: hypothetical protein C923_03048 [Plasmodium falciparum UGT5.1]|uniref:Uncharacterized protein n=3 Tax=Plasmodium falciparum TaxID=5833 RepID=W4J429_PLAFP|nr:LOW QUALITY PROTEIN: hypothetical protein PFNF135_03118 [Plasmodium falciparum NF135/5.C10]ETW56362.1 LOW QUALITY PROTEIN: hypothetical protein PFUGPA_01537 [Plasmodium falciparum Palo Alto/Uganda]EWC76311.1 LOW QUALITY PROTEIN: hypothetical protein C923_03048 [Plasmodium falciparum UGT5.1]